ncbi:MAG: hypothetical protein DRG78_06755 [Epsilonproteobacteria bacterium]|nr:MAG: hypothetical protein DRG78_06755 [Campylobacterota bacterium]
MNYIELDKKNIIATGGERDCYIHPECSQKLIKIAHTKTDTNQMEDIYMTYLNTKNISFLNIAKYYGQINTNFGKGLVYELVLDYNNKISKTFRYYMANDLLPYKIQIQLLNELKLYLQNNNVVFIDNNLDNMLCKKVSQDKYRLVIVDGIGAKRMGFKLWMYQYSKIYSKYKINRQWQKLMLKFKLDRRVIEIIKQIEKVN